jgi:FkbM family methyltransferase
MGYVAAGCAGLVLIAGLAWVGPRAGAVTALLGGKPTRCPLGGTMRYRLLAERFETLRQQRAAEVRSVEQDARFGIERVRTSGRDFWVKSAGEKMDGPGLMAYLQAEHSWITEENPEEQVRPGDTVLDCGAHVGVFTDKALRLGAAKVIAFEIDPVNLECLRRNFAREIAEGRVVIYPKGVWSSEGTMPFTVARTNSGMGSLIFADQGETIQVSITTIDKAVAELELKRVDYVKMDIEGAEREALAGAMETIKRDRPAIMLDFNHRPDDPAVLPTLIRSASQGYREVCGPCEDLGGEFRPHIVYFPRGG